MLSLSPRADLFRFCFPKDFIPDEINAKYTKFLNQNRAVLINPIDYLNESIQNISIPGLSDLCVEQPQIGHNPIIRTQSTIDVEPSYDFVYKSTENPLAKIDRSFSVRMRHNQGLYNYFMMYEIIFYKYCKHINTPSDDVFTVDILGETGEVLSKIYLYDVNVDSIEGLDFDYSKVSRESNPFEVGFKFNNINFDFIINSKENGKDS